MSDLAEVVETRTLGGTCAREYLGYACIAGTGYGCTCDDVATLTSEVVRDEKGAALVLSIELTRYVHDTKPLIAAIGLTGYRADWKVAGGTVEHGVRVRVEYDLYRAENRRLRQH